MSKKTTALALPPDRIDQVFTWILNGGSEHDIIEASQKTWPDCQPMPLIVAAMTRIIKSAESDPSLIRGWCIEATRHVYQKAIDANDLPTALRAVKQLYNFAA